MHKKLIMAFVALAAFVTPSAALASPVLTDSTWAKVPVGEELKGMNTGDILGTGAAGPAWKCTAIDLQFKVTENSGTSIRGEAAAGSVKLTGTGAGGDCTSNSGDVRWTLNSKLCFATAEKDQIQLTGCGGNLVYTKEITGIGPCKYSKGGMTGTFLTVFSDATVNITEQQFSRVESGPFCPFLEHLDLHFDLVTSAGGTLAIS